MRGRNRRSIEHGQAVPGVKEDDRAGDNLPRGNPNRTTAPGAGAAGGKLEEARRRGMGHGQGQTGRRQRRGRRRGEGGRRMGRRIMTYEQATGGCIEKHDEEGYTSKRPK